MIPESQSVCVCVCSKKCISIFLLISILTVSYQCIKLCVCLMTALSETTAMPSFESKNFMTSLPLDVPWRHHQVPVYRSEQTRELPLSALRLTPSWPSSALASCDLLQFSSVPRLRSFFIIYILLPNVLFDFTCEFYRSIRFSSLVLFLGFGWVFYPTKTALLASPCSLGLATSI